MNTLDFLRPAMVSEVPQDHFLVVHPLDDLPEAKVETSTLGPMPMTTNVKLALMTLRGYLVLMMLLVFYHVLDLAGVLGRKGH
ncbi:MAG: hypothetical protein WAQ52_15510 [Terriglobales bacterium]